MGLALTVFKEDSGSTAVSAREGMVKFSPKE